MVLVCKHMNTSFVPHDPVALHRLYSHSHRGD